MNTLERILLEYDEEVDFLKIDGFDDAIIGVEENQLKLVYSIKHCLEILMKEGMSEMDAIEHFEYNIQNNYVGEKTPIFVNLI